ncbi:MAG: gamma carbonic anhydrase family protein [Bilifractor sp.]|jgi:carbonic anhydrase/acetyltransferase-like protein (isoleucine patch superfamily)
MRKIDDSVFQAEGSRIVGDVEIGKDSGVWYNAVIRGFPSQITIGARTNVQDNVVIHGDPESPVVIGNNVTIGHSAIVHGCTIRDNTLIGMGAIVLNRAVIGENCIIGAGALVTQDCVIPDNSLAFGSPARVIRRLTDEEIEGNRISAQHYVDFAKKFM